jgi:non-ribosomal peptide synthetase component F
MPKPNVQKYMERLGLAPEPIVPLDPDWPKMSLEQTKALLTAPGAKFEMETVDIRGVPTRVWKNAPPSLRILAQMVRAYGPREFTIYEKERVTFEANYRATAQMARQLTEMGVKKGDRVALAMRNLPEWPAIFFAAVSIGAIMVPLNAWWTGGELEYALKDSGARVLFVDGERHERLKQ